MTGIDHKELKTFTSKFTKIGNLNLKEVCKQMGSLSGASTFEELTGEFKDLDNYVKALKQETFKIQDFLNE